jgi:hypothetical protein
MLFELRQYRMRPGQRDKSGTDPYYFLLSFHASYSARVCSSGG